MHEHGIDRRPAHAVDLGLPGFRHGPDADVRVVAAGEHAARQLEHDRRDVLAEEEVRSGPARAELQVVAERCQVEEERVVAAARERLHAVVRDDVRGGGVERRRLTQAHRDQHLVATLDLEVLDAVRVGRAEADLESDVGLRIAVVVDVDAVADGQRVDQRVPPNTCKPKALHTIAQGHSARGAPWVKSES